MGDAGSKNARLELKIGEDVHVVLEGDPAFVMEAYRQVREDMTRAIQATAAARPISSEGPPVTSEPIAKAPPSHGASPTPPADPAPPSRRVLWLYRCDDDMRTVYATERAEFARTKFAKAYLLGKIDRVYVEDDRILHALRHGARTLWREIDPDAAEKIKAAADAKRG